MEKKLVKAVVIFLALACTHQTVARMQSIYVRNASNETIWAQIIADNEWKRIFCPKITSSDIAPGQTGVMESNCDIKRIINFYRKDDRSFDVRSFSKNPIHFVVRRNQDTNGLEVLDETHKYE